MSKRFTASKKLDALAESLAYKGAFNIPVDTRYDLGEDEQHIILVPELDHTILSRREEEGFYSEVERQFIETMSELNPETEYVVIQNNPYIVAVPYERVKEMPKAGNQEATARR